MKGFINCFKKYAVFSGRARRSEYWGFYFINLVISLIFTIINAGQFSSSSGFGDMLFGPMYVIISLYGLAVILPGLAVTIRRLHDTNRSGFWVFITMVPLIGSIILLIYMCTDSSTGSNDYGPNPKEDYNPEFE